MAGQVVAYVRVSSEEQHLDRQEAAVREAVGEPDRWFPDRCSGATADRPALTALLAHVRDEDVVVASMDRLARSVPDLFALVDGLTGRGVNVQFVKEGQVFAPGGTASSMSRLLLGVLGAVAEFERAILRERQAEGIRAARARGAYRGSKPRLTAEQIADARERVEAGVPLARVAREAGVARQTLYDALSGRGAYAVAS